MTRRTPLTMGRREFSLALGSALLGPLLGCRPRTDPTDLDGFLADLLARDGVPGFSAAVVVGEELIWSGSYGLADVHGRVPMTPDTIQNIGSVSKTVTATAVMQLWEEGAFDLDDDVGPYLGIPVRNPRFPETPITFRQLLTHRSSITDGPSYGESYACGDPLVGLGEWIEQYLTPGGTYYDPEENFHLWEPGTTHPPTTPRAYSNVGYGVLGRLVEQIEGQAFTEVCRQRIFDPLGMNRTGWMLSEVDTARHAVPHTLLTEDFDPASGPAFDDFLPARTATADMLTAGSYFPHCLYSFYNYPDGLVRTSVTELSRFVRAYIAGGTLGDATILRSDTIDLMLSNEHYDRALCWSTRTLRNGDEIWGHSGGDPGVSTYMAFRKRDGVGVLMFYNCSNPGDGLEEILERLFRLGEDAARA